MLQTDGSNDRHTRRQNVRGVQAAAQTNLDHGQIHLRFRKVHEAHGRCQFVRCRFAKLRPFSLQVIHRNRDSLYQVHKCLGIHGYVVDTQSFAKRVQVRLGIEAGAQTGGAQDGLNDRRSRSLAFAAGHVHAWEALVWIAKKLKQRENAL